MFDNVILNQAFCLIIQNCTVFKLSKNSWFRLMNQTCFSCVLNITLKISVNKARLLFSSQQMKEMTKSKSDTQIISKSKFLKTERQW